MTAMAPLSNTMDTIRAVRCHRFAFVEENKDTQTGRRKKPFRPRSPTALQLRDCLSLDEIPFPDFRQHSSETRVVIRTEYAGIQYPDALQAQGLYQVKPKLPYIPGMDVVGRVLRVIPPKSLSSSSKTNLQPGDRVIATLMNFGGNGGLSEIVVAPLKHVHKVPPSLPAAVFANVGRNYFAAYHALVEVGCIRPRDTVLVSGASGGVGMATIELAKAMGCRVIAGVGSPSKKQGPESLGADAVFCYGRTKAERKAFRTEVTKLVRGVDLVVDVVMGDLFEDALVGCVKPLGTIALVGFAGGQKTIRPGILLVKEVRVAGSIWGRIASEASEERTGAENKFRTMVETILGYFASGAIRGRVDRIVPLSNFVEAFEVFEENKGKGNTVVSFVDQHDANTRSRL